MAIKGGQILHVGNGVAVIDRIQTGGPGQLNIPTEKINELGNYKSVATVRDTPDLTFTMESYDVSTEVESLITNLANARTVTDATIAPATLTVLSSATAVFTAADVGRQVAVAGAGVAGAELVTTIASFTSATAVVMTVAATAGVTNVKATVAVNGIDLAKSTPVDMASQFKAGVNAVESFRATVSVALPFLYLEQMSYRFGMRDNATQSATLRGDTIFYNPGPTFVEKTAASGAVNQAIPTAQPAYQVAEGEARRVLSVTIGTKRLAFGADYTEAYGVVTAGAAITTITVKAAQTVGVDVRVVYASPTSVSYLQAVHPTVAVKPAAVKGRDIEVYIGGYNPNDRPGSQANRLSMVQSVNLDWRVQLEKDEEFGNYYAVGQDFEVPTVNGTVDIKPRDNAELLALLRKVTGVSDATKVIGTSSAVPLAMDVVIKHPETGAVIKRLHTPDARFTVPGFSGRVLQKLTVSLPYESDEGSMLVFER